MLRGKSGHCAAAGNWPLGMYPHPDFPLSHEALPLTSSMSMHSMKMAHKFHVHRQEKFGGPSLSLAYNDDLELLSWDGENYR